MNLNEICKDVAKEISDILTDCDGFTIKSVKPDPRGGWCILLRHKLPTGGELEIDMHLLPMHTVW